MTTPTVTDEAWAWVATASRDALALLGYDIEPKCLPGETDPCGGTWAEHAMAHLAALTAVTHHHLQHLLGDPESGSQHWQNVYAITGHTLAKIDCASHERKERL